ncbi:MAG TPA: inositol monophosphatase family protein, partial [Terriglobales bacterium]
MSQYLEDLQPIAREAGALLMSYFDRHIKIEYKGDADLVTAADRASEKLIVERLQARWPQHGIVGEEGTRSDTGADYRWYVDPLDGTTNFAHGYPVFCVSIALARKDDQLEAGVLYDPTRDELFAAERGQGATLNGKPLHVSKTPRLAESILGTGFP